VARVHVLDGGGAGGKQRRVYVRAEAFTCNGVVVRKWSLVAAEFYCGIVSPARRQQQQTDTQCDACHASSRRIITPFCLPACLLACLAG
jgi:hypothetical protein